MVSAFIIMGVGLIMSKSSVFGNDRFLRKVVWVCLSVLLFTALFEQQCYPAAVEAKEGGRARYVFLFIGDGMALPQRYSAASYLASIQGDNPQPGVVKLTMDQLPVQGMCTTYASDSLIPDSASAGTSLACGYKTADGVIAMDPARKEKYPSIAEKAKAKGMKVGVVSSVSIDHATPAVFYSHRPSREMYYEIATDLANSDFDYFGGGGFKQPKGKDGNLRDVMEICKANGYSVVSGRSEFDDLQPGKAGKVIAVNAVLDRDKALYYEMDRAEDDLTLADYTRKGIELLDNPAGFFMMVEGGKIDWACHANDAAASIHDTVAFDEAVREGLKFYEKHPEETLIVVTGDHECGGMTIGFAGTKYNTFFEKIRGQKLSYIEFDKKLDAYRKSHAPENAKFEDMIPLIEESFGLLTLDAAQVAELEKKAKEGDREAGKKVGMALQDHETDMLREAFKLSMIEKSARGKDRHTYLAYGSYEPLTVTLTHILNQKAGIGWTSYSHTGIPMPVSAVGVGQALFQGYYDNTDVAKKMMSAMGLES